MLSNLFTFVKTKGSSLSLPAHGWVGARATSFLAAHFAKQNTNSVGVQSEGEAEGGCGGEFRLARAEAKPRRPTLKEQTAKEKFCFPFRRKNRARANKKLRTKLFFVGASVSERRRGGASKFCVRIFAKKSSDFVQRSEPNCMLRVYCLGASRLGRQIV